MRTRMAAAPAVALIAAVAPSAAAPAAPQVPQIAAYFSSQDRPGGGVVGLFGRAQRQILAVIYDLTAPRRAGARRRRTPGRRRLGRYGRERGRVALLSGHDGRSAIMHNQGRRRGPA